ncbi:DUF3566 domain-containing protein [Aestuariimicrobium sp. Y1814]|uniref:DUF3566 domain-containing protein n=1 Tax=Aestuariimicrobium sp. Y1814 TaxID=3418742 RepID=UPI003DA76077
MSETPRGSGNAQASPFSRAASSEDTNTLYRPASSASERSSGARFSAPTQTPTAPAGSSTASGTSAGGTSSTGSARARAAASQDTPPSRPAARRADEPTAVPSPAKASKTPSSTPASAASAGSASKPRGASSAAASPARRTRKARLRLARLDPWSVMKTSFLFSIAFGILLMVAVWVLWAVLQSSGTFEAINRAVNDLLATPNSASTFDLGRFITGDRVLGFTALIAAVDVVIFTALATLFSFLYNLSATVLGGLEVTLAED